MKIGVIGITTWMLQLGYFSLSNKKVSKDWEKVEKSWEESYEKFENRKSWEKLRKSWEQKSWEKVEITCL